jgi:hypothetical protein
MTTSRVLTPDHSTTSFTPLSRLIDMSPSSTISPQEMQDHNLTTTGATSDETEMAAPPPKTHCTFAVHTGLTDSPALPPEVRLEVYKKAFPEMDRSVVRRPARYSQAGYEQPVYITPDSKCWTEASRYLGERRIRLEQFPPKDDGTCTCQLARAARRTSCERLSRATSPSIPLFATSFLEST